MILRNLNKCQKIGLIFALSSTGLNAFMIFNTIPLSVQRTFIFEVMDLTLMPLFISFYLAGSIKQYIKNRRDINW